jgi:hypothetical protein
MQHATVQTTASLGLVGNTGTATRPDTLALQLRNAVAHYKT